MSTVKFACWLVVGCLASSVAFGQYDVPPSLPDFSKPANAKTTELAFPDFPELPDAPPAVKQPAATRPPAIVTPRPQRLSAESTANLPKHVQNLIDFYGGATSARALSQLPQRPSTGVARPTPPQQRRKPFEGTVSGAPPTISPYLNLYLDESEDGLPNYHAYVRPLQQQLQANAAARQRINTLQHEVQQVSYGQPIQQTTGGSVPGTGHGTRYFNTTQFYPQTRRLR